MLFLFVMTAALVGLDQLFKYLAVVYLQPVRELSVWPGIVGLRYVENDGAAFSILSGSQTFLILLTSAALIALCWYLLTKRYSSKGEFAALLLIFAGGIGNLIDRVRQGFVVDYIRVEFMNFAVFNFADCLVCIGIALLLVVTILEMRKEKKQVGADE